MKIFIWDYVDKLTQSYHSGGGLVVFADSEERARELAKIQMEKDQAESYYQRGTQLPTDQKPSIVVNCSDYEERVLIFPDAGCC